MGKKLLATEARMEMTDAVKCMSIIGDSYHLKKGDIEFEYLENGKLHVGIHEEAFESPRVQRFIGAMALHGADWILMEKTS